MKKSPERKLVLINMSDREDSNSDKVLAYFQQILEQTVTGVHVVFDRIDLLKERNDSSCIGCVDCHRDVNAHNDEYPGIYKRMLDADVLVAASPTQAGIPSPLGCTLIARTDPFFAREGSKSKFADKKAMGMVTAGSTEDRAEHVLGSLEYWFKTYQMDVVQGVVIVGASNFRDDHFPVPLPEDVKKKIEDCAARIASLIVKE